MQHRSYRLMSLIAVIALTLGTFFNAGAKGDTQSPSQSVGRIFYVSATGSDSNPGTTSAPFKTFSKAVSMLAAGDELQIYGGTYTEQLNVNKSGTSSAPITVKAVPGQSVIIDGGGSRDELVFVPDGASYVNIRDLTCKRASSACVVVRGTHITISGFDVSEGQEFGIRVTGSYITVENSRIHDNVLENLNGVNTTGGWGSALRSAQGSGSNNIFRYNQVYHNWGEGIIMGSNNSQVYGNQVYDNFSKNIYIGNTYNVDVYQNITHSTDSRWFRAGSPADCISMSEELINDTYGARLGNIRIFNNIAANCKSGIGYTYAEVSGNGCDNCLIAFNTISAVQNICIKVIAGSKNHMQIVDNICTTRAIEVPSGDIRVSNNTLGDARLTGGAIGDPNSYKPLTDSPVIGAGINAGISSDYFGVSRSRYDIGAIQAASAPPPPTAFPPSPVPTATAVVPTPTTVIIPTATAIVPTVTAILPSPTALLPTATAILPSPTAILPTSASQPPAGGSQTFDDKNGVFIYTGIWQDVSVNGSYQGSFKKSMAPGQSVSMTFAGTSFSIFYTANTGFARMDVKVDGVVVGTIDQSASSRQLQKRWNLPVALANGTHTVTLIHRGSDTSSRVSLDAITVYSSIVGPTSIPPTVAANPTSSGSQTFDDKNSVFLYTGTWEDVVVASAYQGSFKKSMAPGQSVSMTFTGRSFSIIYTVNTGFATMNVLVDGVRVGTINQDASFRVLQKVWTLPTPLAAGTHTLKLVHAGTNASSRLSLDAVTIYP